MGKIFKFLLKKYKRNKAKTMLLGKCAGKKIISINGATLTIDNGAEERKAINQQKIQKMKLHKSLLLSIITLKKPQKHLMPMQPKNKLMLMLV